MGLGDVLYGLDLAGVIVFAASGALAAARKNMDIFGFIVIATVTGIGGGTIRDLLLGAGPVFWVNSPIYLVLTTATAILTFFIAPHLESRLKVLLWADAVGLAVFCTLGVDRALSLPTSGLIAVLMGVITATFGGLVRDVLCNEIPLLLQKEIYALAALAGAATHVSMLLLIEDGVIAVIVAAGVAFVVRALAMVYEFSLPGYGKNRP